MCYNGFMKLTDKIIIEAPAKVNLGLDVVKRREDGYHEVDMIMQTIGLHDTVIVEKTKEPGIMLRTNREELPTDQGNLAFRAAELLQKTCHIKEGVSIQIEKRIPIAAGLAGGSTDCAAVLMGMNEVFSLGLSGEKLEELGLTLGADVPYCIRRGTQRARGIGEKLSGLPTLPRIPALIAKPKESVSTGAVYRGLSLNAETIHPDIDALEEAVRSFDLTRIAANMGNLLENVTIPMLPVIDRIKSCMMENGAVVSMMSGSGPTVFGLFSEERVRDLAEEALRQRKLADQIFPTCLE